MSHGHFSRKMKPQFPRLLIYHLSVEMIARLMGHTQRAQPHLASGPRKPILWANRDHEVLVSPKCPSTERLNRAHYCPAVPVRRAFRTSTGLKRLEPAGMKLGGARG